MSGNPLERPLRAIGVSDPAVIRAVLSVARAGFLPEEHRASAGENEPLPIGSGQTISAPDVVGWMTQALGVGPGDRVLDVGTGSGWQAAILAALGCRVFSVEIVPELSRTAALRLRDLGYGEVRVRCGDGALGWPEEAPFDGIVVAAAAVRVPPALVDQLGPGARLVLPVGPHGGPQVLRVVEKGRDGKVLHHDTLPVRFVPMIRDPGN
jgi:protein-L-isoaspartate(D-aspartate) O-methyltransferase